MLHTYAFPPPDDDDLLSKGLSPQESLWVLDKTLESRGKLTEEVVVSNVEVVDAIVGEAWCWCLAVLLGLKDEGQELLDGGHGDVTAVVSRNQDLALEIQDEDGGHCGCHLSESCPFWGAG